MKLSTARIQRTLDQLEEHTALQDASMIREDNPIKPKLSELFGDHTFFLDGEGIHIVEPAEPRSSVPTGKIIKLAGWKDNSRTTLTPQRPQVTDIVVVLGDEEDAEKTDEESPE
jgi:hypothetical protein